MKIKVKGMVRYISPYFHWCTTVDRALEIPDLRYVDRWHVIQMYDRHTFNSRRQLIHLNGQSMLAR